MLQSHRYFLYSSLPDGPNVGILRLPNVQQEAAGQPVRLHVDLVKWSTPRDILGSGGPTTFGVGPYKYTTSRGSEVYASNEPNSSWVWWLIPAQRPNTFAISLGGGSNLGWTAGEAGEPITIQPLTGAPNQTFELVPCDEA